MVFTDGTSYREVLRGIGLHRLAVPLIGLTGTMPPSIEARVASLLRLEVGYCMSRPPPLEPSHISFVVSPCDHMQAHIYTDTASMSTHHALLFAY